MYKTYKIDLKDIHLKRIGTDGYQPKFIVDNGDTFLKVQCKLNGTYMNDWRVEEIASKIGTFLGFNIVQQTPCNVQLINNKTITKLYGVYSKNFEKQGKRFKSLEGLFEDHSLSLSKSSEFISLNDTEKMMWISNIVSKISHISYNKYLDYLIKVAIIDIFVCNVDRHTRNLGYIYDSTIGKEIIAPIFDCGMGLFESDTYFRQIKDFR